MTKEELQQSIKELEPWYHPIDFGNGVVVKGSTSAYLEGRSKKQVGLSDNQRGIAKWNKYIKPNLPISVKGIRILDIGCSAGLFSMKCLRDGANYVCGVEYKENYVQQAELLKRFYSDEDGVDYKFDVVHTDMCDTDKYLYKGPFDLCMMLNVFRMIKDYDESVDYLCKIRQSCTHLLIQGTYGNGRDDNPVLQEKMSKAGFKAKMILMSGKRGIIGLGK